MADTQKQPPRIYGDEVPAISTNSIGVMARAQEGVPSPRHIRNGSIKKRSGSFQILGSGDVLLAQNGSKFTFSVGYGVGSQAVWNAGFGVKIEIPQVKTLVDALYFPAKPGQSDEGWIYRTIDRDDDGREITVELAKEKMARQSMGKDQVMPYWKLRFLIWPIVEWEQKGEVFKNSDSNLRTISRSATVSEGAGGYIGAVGSGRNLGQTTNMSYARIVSADEQGSAADITLHILAATADQMTGTIEPAASAS